MLVNFVTTIGGLSKGDLVAKLVSFGANGVIIFWGLKTKETMQLLKNMDHLSLVSFAWLIPFFPTTSCKN
jgi:uncharacterized Rmd1/YagE family protein